MKLIKIMYVAIMIALLASSYALGQGVELWDGIQSNAPDTAFSVKSKIYLFGHGEFRLGTYDRDSGPVYGIHFSSLEHFPYDSLEKRNVLLDSVRVDFFERFGEPSLNNAGGYLPFMGYNQNFTLYAWKNGQRIIMISLFGRRDASNIIKIEIFDVNMLE